MAVISVRTVEEAKRIIDNLLSKLKELRGSDLHVKSGAPVVGRIHGELIEFKAGKESMIFSPETVELIVKTVSEKESLKNLTGINCAYETENGRFRINAFKQKRTWSLVARVINEKIPSIEELNLPSILKELALVPRGLVLVTGITGSGKSTTLASMLEHLNNTKRKVVITIEDPIEYVYRDKLCYFYQREVGIDTPSFYQAVKDALREDPDVILVGEMRDRETVEAVLHAAETGHTVFSTLHTIDAKETINRIISMFPPEQERQIRYLLASTLKASISQRLIRRADGKGRIPALEILINTETIKERIMKPEKTHEIYEFMEKGEVYGMITMDGYLKKLVQKRLITPKDALENASKKEEFLLFLKGIK